MGATCTVIRLSERSLQELLEEPARLQPFLWGQTAPLTTQRPGFLQRLLGKRPREIQPVTEAREEGDSCYLDKTWAALHFLLTGTPADQPTNSTLGFLVSGGTNVGSTLVDGVHGFRSAEVAATWEVLSKVEAKEMRARYSPIEMDRLEVYPKVWVREGQAGLDYLLNHFSALREFVGEAARRERSLLIKIDS